MTKSKDDSIKEGKKVGEFHSSNVAKVPSQIPADPPPPAAPGTFAEGANAGVSLPEGKEGEPAKDPATGLPVGEQPRVVPGVVSSTGGVVSRDESGLTERRGEKILVPAFIEVDRSVVQAEPVEASEPEDMGNGFTKVNLATVCIINGSKYGPGRGVLVPSDAFEVWRHALSTYHKPV